MDSIFTFLQPEENPPPGESVPAAATETPAATPTPSGGTPAKKAAETVTANIQASSQDKAQVLNDMMAQLSGFLPPPIGGVPNPAVYLLSLNEAPVGLGNFISTQPVGPVGFTQIKGGRLDVLIRFELWGSSQDQVNNAVLLLQSQLLAARDTLWNGGFLSFTAVPATGSNFDTGANAWNRSADYQALYEYQYHADDDTQSLIARIPIHADQEVPNSLPRENTLVTDDLVRWDNLAAPTLILRGPATFHRFAGLAFFTANHPTGPVTLTRTYEGATDPVQDYPTLNDFLAAINDPTNPQLTARLVFASLTDFLAVFTPSGADLTLGDWDQNTVLDDYQGLDLTLTSPIQCQKSSDRLEVMYANGGEPFDQVAVLYLKLVD